MWGSNSVFPSRVPSAAKLWIDYGVCLSPAERLLGHTAGAYGGHPGACTHLDAAGGALRPPLLHTPRSPVRAVPPHGMSLSYQTFSATPPPPPLPQSDFVQARNPAMRLPMYTANSRTCHTVLKAARETREVGSKGCQCWVYWALSCALGTAGQVRDSEAQTQQPQVSGAPGRPRLPGLPRLAAHHRPQAAPHRPGGPPTPLAQPPIRVGFALGFWGVVAAKPFPPAHPLGLQAKGPTLILSCYSSMSRQRGWCRLGVGLQSLTFHTPKVETPTIKYRVYN